MSEDTSSRIKISDEIEDYLFRIFDDSQGLQRRVFRLLSRGFYNEHALDELRRQAESIVRDIELLGADAP